MNREISPDYAVIVLTEILLEQKLINKATFDAISEKVRNEKSHISHGNKKSV